MNHKSCSVAAAVLAIGFTCPTHADLLQHIRDHSSGGKILHLKLDHSTVRVQVTERRDQPAGRYAIRGVLDEPGDSFILCGDDDSAAGLIWHNNSCWRIVLRENSTRTYRLDDHIPTSSCAGGISVPQEGDDAPASGGVAGSCGDPNVIDILVLVSDDAYQEMKDLMSDFTTLANEVAVSIEIGNNTFAQSGLDTRLNLVHARHIPASEGEPTLFALRSQSDNIIDWVHRLREYYGADLVQMFQADTGGSAYMPQPENPQNPSFAFSVANAISASMSPHGTHEIGHNLGCCHAPDDGNCSNPFYTYSYGRRFFGKSGAHLRTVMAYGDYTITRIGAFTGPDVIWDGVPTGVGPDDPSGEPESDNARTIAQNTQEVHEYRCNDGICEALGLGPFATDCNGNGIPDECEIAHHPSLDQDGNGRLDSCTCLADFNGDGEVNGGDLAAVLGGWGGTSADLNEDGVVDGADLATVLASWGSCQ